MNGYGFLTPAGAPCVMAKTLGERIRARREELGMGQVELADAIGIRAHVMWRYEAGKSRPSADRLAEIASALKTTSEALLHGESESTPEITYEPLDDESRPMVDRLLDIYGFAREKRAWVREHLPEFAYSTGATPTAVTASIEALAREYDYAEGTKIPPPERERVEEPKRSPNNDVMTRPRNKKPKR